MCPLRFILVFLSAVLAGYFAWRTMRSSPEFDLTENEELVQDKALESSKDEQKQERSLIKMTQDGFWVFVDMASGRYLWRNFKEMKDEKAKSC